MKSVARLALVMNVALIGLGLLGVFVDAPVGSRVGAEWRIAVPIVVGCLNVAALRLGRRSEAARVLTVIWSLMLCSTLPFLYPAAKDLLRPVPLQWHDPIRPTWIEYADFVWLGAANLSAMLALGFVKHFRPPWWLSVPVLPTLVVLHLVTVSDRVERVVEELIYGPVPSDPVASFGWFAEHDAPREHAFGWFLLLWILYFLVGAFRAIPRYSPPTPREVAA
ncbi:MAG: hypothetical protein KDC14_13775 [Planctomycetes bacterium]|nr:hypothetical protein [Planctomycetota bacterium]